MSLPFAGLLSRAGVLSPDAIEEAVGRQEARGGTLDTSLLELGLLDEQTLATYLERASEFPLASSKKLSEIDPALKGLLPARLAERYGVIPFLQVENEVHLACCHPVEAAHLDEMALLLSKKIIAHTAPEIRIRLAQETLYEVPASRRFHELADRLAIPRTPPPKGGDQGHVPPVEEALAWLGTASDHGEALDVLLEFAASQFEVAATLIVQGGRASLRGVLGAGVEPKGSIRALSFGLDEPSVLQVVVNTGGRYLGPITDNDPLLALAAALERPAPRSVLVEPIVVGGRTVALLLAENGGAPLIPDAIDRVMRVGQAVGPVFEKLIRERKLKKEAPARTADEMRERMGGGESPSVGGVGRGSPESARIASEPGVGAEPRAASPSPAHLVARGGSLREPVSERELRAGSRAVEKLLALRSEEDPREAMEELLRLGSLAAELLVALLPEDEARFEVGRAEVHRVPWALERLGAQALPALRRAAGSPAPAVRFEAARLLRRCDPTHSDPALAVLIGDEHEAVAQAAKGLHDEQ